MSSSVTPKSMARERLMTASLNYIPGLTDAEGRAFGVFALDIFDDRLHVASAAWAGIAARPLEPGRTHIPPVLRLAVSHRRTPRPGDGFGISRPGQSSITERHVEQLLVRGRDLGLARLHEIPETGGRDEVFAQDVGARRIAVVERDGRLVHQRVARCVAVDARTERDLGPPAETFGPVRLHLRTEQVTGGAADEAGPRCRGDTPLIVCWPVGDQQRPVEEPIEGHIHPSVGHLDRRVGRELTREASPISRPPIACRKRSGFSVREHVTTDPSVRIIVSARVVLPHPLNVTGQPCALTENVLATPKSLLDCMTTGEKPSASSRSMTVDQRVPAATR
jgi:hypothetical protein